MLPKSLTRVARLRRRKCTFPCTVYCILYTIYYKPYTISSVWNSQAPDKYKDCIMFHKEVAQKSNTSNMSENFEVQKGFPDQDALLTQKVIYANIALCQSLKLFK
jgi:hypothetical protein